MELHAAGLLAALAATVFAAQSAGRNLAQATLFAVFAAAAHALTRLAPPDPATLGFCVAAAAVSSLARPRWWLLPPLAGGAVGAVWISVLEAQGLPWLAGAPGAAFLLATAVSLAARRRGFMPPEVRDEALVLVAAFALLLALVPDVVEGWRASLALKAEPLAAAGPQAGPWLGALVAATVLLGGAYSLWKRR